MGIFSQDKTTTNQTTFQQQVATESGTAVGAYGVLGSGNVSGGIASGASFGQGTVINISSPDQAAIDLARQAVELSSNNTVTALSSAQALSQQALTNLNTQATGAMQTLALLNTEKQVGDVGGSAGQVAGVASGNFDFQSWFENNKTLVIAAGVLLVASVLLLKYRKAR